MTKNADKKVKKPAAGKTKGRPLGPDELKKVSGGRGSNALRDAINRTKGSPAT
jgi:hypothetical protein